ncbi:hypothetical protein HYDPIDRAFT_166052 [Hydnomerulius pinastri MD-312]|nr:hypothetical protein HYDPIDRAFT_166052 [Hydnomerulius pinastri MD-312]
MAPKVTVTYGRTRTLAATATTSAPSNSDALGPLTFTDNARCKRCRNRGFAICVKSNRSPRAKACDPCAKAAAACSLPWNAGHRTRTADARTPEVIGEPSNAINAVSSSLHQLDSTLHQLSTQVRMPLFPQRLHTLDAFSAALSRIADVQERHHPYTTPGSPVGAPSLVDHRVEDADFVPELAGSESGMSVTASACRQTEGGEGEDDGDDCDEDKGREDDKEEEMSDIDAADAGEAGEGPDASGSSSDWHSESGSLDGAGV